MSTIAAISTAQGMGGIGVVRISGEDAVSIGAKVFKPMNESACFCNTKGYTAKYGKVIYGGKFIDEAVALVFRAPHSYTGEDVVEISCHGGMYLCKRVLRAVLDCGAVPAAPGEFTKRAFLNGKMDLSQAESVMDLIQANSCRANTVAFGQIEGAVTKKTNCIKEKLLDLVASLSVWTDYPEEDIPQVSEKELKKHLCEIKEDVFEMIKNYDVCVVLKQGVKTAIIGPPNAGKSTLMNLFSGFEKSIVTNIAGTTRDLIEETVMFGDIPLVLADTAGIRETDNIIEKIGVEKAKKHMNICDLVFCVLDASVSLSPEDEEILKACDFTKTIIVLNKIDLGVKIKKEELFNFSNKIVEFSATKGTGTEVLKTMVETMVGLSGMEPSETAVSNERQFSILKRVHENLEKIIHDICSGVTLDAVTVLIQDTAWLLTELTGENVSDEVINRVFSKFCVGK